MEGILKAIRKANSSWPLLRKLDGKKLLVGFGILLWAGFKTLFPEAELKCELFVRSVVDNAIWIVKDNAGLIGAVTVAYGGLDKVLKKSTKLKDEEPHIEETGIGS